MTFSTFDIDLIRAFEITRIFFLYLFIYLFIFYILLYFVNLFFFFHYLILGCKYSSVILLFHRTLENYLSPLLLFRNQFLSLSHKLRISLWEPFAVCLLHSYCFYLFYFIYSFYLISFIYSYIYTYIYIYIYIYICICVYIYIYILFFFAQGKYSVLLHCGFRRYWFLIIYSSSDYIPSFLFRKIISYYYTMVLEGLGSHHLFQM